MLKYFIRLEVQDAMRPFLLACKIGAMTASDTGTTMTLS